MTVRKRQLKNGFCWEFCITVCKNPRKQLRKSGFKTKGEAQKAEQETLTKINLGKVCSDAVTFKEVADCFMKHAENYSKSTECNYQNMLDNHLKCFLAYRTKDIYPLLIDKWIDEMLKTNSPFVTVNCIRFCKAMYNYAKSLDIVETNPFEKARKIRLPKKIHGRLEPQQAANILIMCRDIYPEMLGIIALGMFAGLRRGEILGLKWADIDFASGYIKIERQYTKYGLKEQLKTNESRRNIKMCETLKQILLFHKKQLKVLSQFVFVNKNGGMVSLKTLQNRFKKLLEICGLGRDFMRFHDLRGTYVDLSIKAGVPLKIIQRSVGHSKITTTSDIYAEILQSVEDNAAILFEKNLQFCEHIVNI